MTPSEADRRWADDMPDTYQNILVPAVFDPFASDLADRIAADRPKRVLEVAAGTGALTRYLLAVPGIAEVVATDLNPSMVDTGKARAPLARWQPADALDLPFPASEFDVVACQFGVMFFPDKPAGFAEARRVLAPGGAYHANSWATLDEHGLEVPFTAAVRAVLPDDPPDFLAKVPHGYADPDRFADDVRAGGFTNVTVETVRLQGRPVTAREIALGYCTGTPTRAGLEARGDLVTLTEAITGELERIIGTDPIAPPMAAHVLRADLG